MCWWRPFSNCDFEHFYTMHRNKKWHFLESRDQTCSETRISYPKNMNLKIWPYMTLGRPDPSFDPTWMESDCKTASTFEFYVKIDHKSRATFPKRTLILLTFGDLSRPGPYIVWHLWWPFDVTLAEFRARAIDVVSLRFHHTETSKFDILPNLDRKFMFNLKILSMPWGVSWRAFERRLAGLHMTIGSGDDMGGGADPPPPPRGRGYGNSPGGAGLIVIIKCSLGICTVQTLW